VIVVVDYGVGNIGSVLNMIRKVGGEVVTSASSEDVERAQKIVLPGVGSFDHAVRRLQQLGLTEPIRACAQAGVPLLGICLGMQLLSFASEEGELPGLGLVPGRVRRFGFGADFPLLRIPHMGWNQVAVSRPHPLAAGLQTDARFYFVHSYHYECDDPADELFSTHHGYEFTSGIQHGNIMGVQFHPEKSHRFGMQLFKNFISL
jgi:glutamine amidotransferase